MAPSQNEKLDPSLARPIPRRSRVRRNPSLNEERLAAAQWQALSLLLAAAALCMLLVRLQQH